MFTGVISSSNRRALGIAGILAVFILSFSIPIFLLYSFFSDDSADLNEAEEVIDTFLPGAKLVKGAGAYLSVQNHESLDADSEHNFTLGIWLKPRRLPREGEKITFLAKFEGDYVTRRGYRLSLLREEGSIFPVVWWQDSSGNGGAYRFSKMEIIPDRWIFLSLSLQDGQFLGLHGAVVLSPAVAPDVELLGGYELDPPVYPYSSANLLIGARGEGGFRGLFGPVFISKESVPAEELGDVLAELVQHPSELPGALRGDDLSLWVPGGEKDLSEKEQIVQFHEGAGRDRGKKGEKKKKRLKSASKK